MNTQKLYANGLRPLHRAAFSFRITADGHWLLEPVSGGWELLGRRDEEHEWLQQQGIAGAKGLRLFGSPGPQMTFSTISEALSTLSAALAADPPATPFPARTPAVKFVRTDTRTWRSACGHFQLADEQMRRGLTLTCLTEEAQKAMDAAYPPAYQTLFPVTVREAQFVASGILHG